MSDHPGAARLLGSWRLRDFTVTYADERPPTRPFGEGPQGLLVYAPDGWMSAVLARAERAPLGADRLETSGWAAPQDKAAAFDSYLSYAGRWSLRTGPAGLEVVHRVTHALVPELVGVDNVRRVRFAGDALVLDYTWAARSGVARTNTLTWGRP
jgi:hypothetical protein